MGLETESFSNFGIVRVAETLMEKIEKVVKKLREKYDPEAVILHGSRAVGKERVHSDWDIILLFKSEIPRGGYREKVEGEDVEWKAYIIPSTDDSIIDTFDMYLQFAKVLWEKGRVGSDLLERASMAYSKGPQLSADDIRREKQFLEHKLLSMGDDVHTPYMFLRHLSVFFNRASNLWFEILHKEFPKPFYLAIPEIVERDEEYAKYLEKLYSNISEEKKIEAGRKILEKLFKDSI